MALSETTSIESIEVLEDETLIVTEATKVLRDGVVIATTRSRRALMPGDPIEDRHPKVRALAGLLWTEEIKAARAASIAAAEARVKGNTP